VASQAFIWILGALTMATGITLVAMLVRRRRDRLRARARRRRPIDAYAIPVALPAPSAAAAIETPSEHDDELAKICPACGSRYGHQFRTCARDNSELAALN
jgi:hypothetical protein